MILLPYHGIFLRVSCEETDWTHVPQRFFNARVDVFQLRDMFQFESRVSNNFVNLSLSLQEFFRILAEVVHQKRKGTARGLMARNLHED